MAARDIVGSPDRDQACTSHLDPCCGSGLPCAADLSRGPLAVAGAPPDLAPLSAEPGQCLFGLDIHPGARDRQGDLHRPRHRRGDRQTAVVGDGVSMLHGVTLGGTGKERGDRHPRCGRGVLLAPGPRCWSNIEIGACAKIAAGSVVLEPVPAGAARQRWRARPHHRLRRRARAGAGDGSAHPEVASRPARSQAQATQVARHDWRLRPRDSAGYSGADHGRQHEGGR